MQLIKASSLPLQLVTAGMMLMVIRLPAQGIMRMFIPFRLLITNIKCRGLLIGMILMVGMMSMSRHLVYLCVPITKMVSRLI